MEPASAAAGQLPRVIDVWMQPSTKILATHEIFEPLRRWGTSVKREATAEETVAYLDQASVRVGLLSAWSSPQGYLVSNDEVEAMVRQYPSRLQGICAVNIRRPMKAIEELRACVKRGFVGMRLVPWLWVRRRFSPSLPCKPQHLR